MDSIARVEQERDDIAENINTMETNKKKTIIYI